MIDNLEVLAELGQGGFGTVYKARQRTTGQTVALKVMRAPEQDSLQQREKRVARFLLEASLCAQLHHPNIVQLIDSGRAADGALYTVFSFAPGDTLADLLAREGALAPAEARHLMLQVLDALSCAHAQGVVHRDLKPRNLMILNTSARRNALVLDFGIGAMVDAAPAGSGTRLTGTNETLGTPGYAAPEQLRGQEPTPRTDLFAWGLVFLECLTGRPVYGGDSAADLIYRQLSPEPVAIPPLLKWHPLGELLRVVLRKDVAAREVTAAGVLAALEGCDLRGLPRGLGSEPPSDTAGAGSATTIGAIGPVHSISPGGTQASGEGERRQIMAVFCHAGVQSLTSDPLAAEAEDELLRAGLAFAAEVGRRHRGHPVAVLGDALLLYFGYPRAEEDDAVFAARAAVAILAMAEAQRETFAARGARLQVRLGIHAGLVLTRDSRDTGDAALAAGSTPHRAAQLAARAEPGTILLSADAHRLLRGAFDSEAEGAGAAAVFRLGRARPAAIPATGMASAPLVGRAGELELLLDRWRRTIAGGGQCVLITGEPGIGKSRLTRELRDHLAGQAHLYLEGRCAPDTQNNPLFPMIDLLGRMLELDRELTPTAKVARLKSQLVRRGLSAAEALPLFLPLFSLPFPEDASAAPLAVTPQKLKELTHSAIVTLLIAMSEECPVLLLVEDLHWADPTTLELLGQLVYEAPSAALCLLLTARPEFTPAFPTTSVLQLHLNRLDRAQIDALATRAAGNKRLPPAVLERVASRTEGVPLFVEELTRMMIESGTLVEHADRWELQRAFSELEIPTTLRALLTARLDRLGRARETAQLAAALGREFQLELLAAVSPLGATALQEDLEQLLAAGLVFRRRRGKDATFLFKHALIRDAAYETLPGETRLKVHARIAGTLEERFPAIVESRPDLLAAHCEAAGWLHKAAPYLRRAGEQVMQRGAYVESIADFTRGIALVAKLGETPAGHQQELDLRIALGAALIGTRGYCAPEVEQNVLRARTLCSLLGHPPEQFPVLYALWSVGNAAGRCAQEDDSVSQLMDYVRRNPSPIYEVTANFAHGMTLFYRGQIAQARTAHERAVSLWSKELHGTLVRIYGDDHGLYSLTYLAYEQMHQGQLDAARQSEARYLAVAEELGNPLGLALTLLSAMTMRIAFRDVDGAAALSARLVDVSLKHGFPWWREIARCGDGWARAQKGDHAGGIAEIERCIGFFHYIAQKRTLTYYLGLLVEALLLASQYDKGIAVADEALALAKETRELLNVPELLKLKGELIGAQDPTAADAALACFTAAIAAARQIGSLPFELRAATSMARVLLKQGERARAHATLSPVLDTLREGADTPDYCDAKALLAELT